MALSKSLRRTLIPVLDRLGIVTDAEQKTLSAIRSSINTNGTALYNLLHCMPILEYLADVVGQTFENKIVLEIGTTDPPGLPLAMLLGGCSKFYGSNILEVQNHVPMDYAEVVNLMLSRLRGTDPLRLQQLVNCEAHSGQRIATLKNEVFEAFAGCSAENLSLPDESIDIVFSMSVMEHLEYTREVLHNLHRMLRPGGVGLHLIDLRDHNDFTKPLEFLKHDKAKHDQSGGSYQNRLRARDFLQLFEETGYQIEWTGYMPQPPGVVDRSTTDLFSMGSKPIADMYPYPSIESLDPCVDDALMASLHADFQGKTRQELSVMGMCVVCRRPT